MRWRDSLRCAAILLIAVAMAVPVMAQTATTGVIEGRVTDERGGPLAGAEVTAIGARAPVTVTTGAEGRFLIPNLPPGEYKVQASAKGYGTVVQQNIQVSINSRSQVGFRLAPGKVEEVTVTAEAPLVDTKSVTTGQTFTVSKYVDYLPIGRSFSQTFTLAPGVESGLGTGAGNYSISGSSGLENSYLVDGVNITNTGYGGLGSYNGVYGSLGSGVTYDFLEEIQVKTGGIDAEFGQATGGVVNTVVKSGTNAFTGSIGAFWAPKDLRGNETPVSLSVGAINQTDTETVDLALSVGGPIVKDKLFYFLAYNPTETKTGNMVEYMPLLPAFSSGVATYPSLAFSPLETKRKSDNYAAKFTWYMNPNHRLELSGFGDPSSGDMGVQRTVALKYFDFAQGGGQSEIDYGGDNYSLKYDAVITPTFFLQAQAARHDAKFEEVSAVNQPQLQDTMQLRCFLGIGSCPSDGSTPRNGANWYYGGVGFISNQTDKNDQFKLGVTWLLGNHELKAGLQYDDIEYGERQEYTGTPQAYRVPLDIDLNGGYDLPEVDEDDPLLPLPACALNEDGTVSDEQAIDCYIDLPSASGALITKRTNTDYRVIRTRFNTYQGPTTSEEYNFYISDSWAVTPRWNVKLGARVTRQKMTGAGNLALPFSLNYYDETNPLTFSRTRGSELYTAREYTFPTEVVPRLGATWDLKGDGRQKLYASASRYVERIPGDLAVRALSNELGISSYRFRSYNVTTGVASNPQVTYNPNLGGNPNTAINWTGLQPSVISENTKLPYVDELVFGYQQEVGRDLSLELRAIYREVGRSLEDIQYVAAESIQNLYYGTGYGYPFDPFPGYTASPFGAYVLANPGDNTPSTFPKAVRDYTAYEIIANKRFADRWMLYANFRYAELRGFYEGLYRNDNGQDDPNITSLYDFPNSPLMAGQFMSGPLNTDRPYSLKVNASYSWDNGVTLGGSFNWSSGVPRQPLLAHPVYWNSGEVPGADPVYGWWSTAGYDPALANCRDGLCLLSGTLQDYNADADAQSGSFILDYTKVKRGGLGRTPDIANLDLTVAWNKQLGKTNLQLMAAVFNVLNTREVLTLNDLVERQYTLPNPDYNRVTSYQDPRSIRLSARWSF